MIIENIFDRTAASSLEPHPSPRTVTVVTTNTTHLSRQRHLPGRP
jgi:hypothetical protein